jgi:hypothetical protein
MSVEAREAVQPFAADPGLFDVVAIVRLRESPLNPRRHYDQKKIEELAESIKSVGIIEPIVVLLGVVQLALRHPGVRGRPSEGVAREFARQIEERIVAIAPALKEICAAGWDPRADV